MLGPVPDDGLIMFQLIGYIVFKKELCTFGSVALLKHTFSIKSYFFDFPLNNLIFIECPLRDFCVGSGLDSITTNK